MSRYYNDYLQYSDEDTLAHFGIPGMKWGQRKIQDHISLSNKIREERRIANQEYRRRKTRFGNEKGGLLTRLKNVGNKNYLAQINSEIAAEKRMQKKYGDSYVKQKNARERKKLMLTAAGLAASTGALAYKLHKIKNTHIYTNTKHF